MINVSKPYNSNILKVLKLSQEMLSLAEQGDSFRQDRSCGVIYGILRDSAYRLQILAAKEVELHRRMGSWDIDDQTTESFFPDNQINLK